MYVREKTLAATDIKLLDLYMLYYYISIVTYVTYVYGTVLMFRKVLKRLQRVLLKLFSVSLQMVILRDINGENI